MTVSKIFPAGLGWQSASLLADNTMGYASDSASFALTTGLGDALGVLAGHCLYYGLKKSTGVDSEINLTREWHTGVLLGSAAMMSGTAWQPLVNALQGANLGFTTVMAGTWIGCGVAFYTGLRVARTVLSDQLTSHCAAFVCQQPNGRGPVGGDWRRHGIFCRHGRGLFARTEFPAGRRGHFGYHARRDGMPAGRHLHQPGLLRRPVDAQHGVPGGQVLERLMTSAVGIGGGLTFFGGEVILLSYFFG